VTITRVGTNQQYADGWEAAFSGKRGGSKSSASKKSQPKKSAKKSGKKVRK
jgi:hypothetical protein